MKPVAVIVAGGAGLRLGAEMPKQFLPIGGTAMIVKTARAFAQAIPGITIIVALPETYLSFGEKLLKDAGIKAQCVTGGIERYHSVKNALQILGDEPALVAVQDAARPFVSAELIRRCFDEAAIYGSAIPFIPVKDSIRQSAGEDAWVAVDRNAYRAVQTPQVFNSMNLKKAYEGSFRKDFTDDATVYEAAGNALHFTAGEEKNIKITTSQDFAMANYLAEREKAS
jgi:2-C-methyl-D-erythritol 4-phosphate cytidylyltransferase